MESILAQKQEAGAAQVTKMTGKEAGQALVSSEYVAPLEFDEKQGKLLGISEGATVSVTPEDTGTWSRLKSRGRCADHKSRT
jgi:hypothetical protein